MCPIARAGLLVLSLTGIPPLPNVVVAQQPVPAVASEEDARLVAKLVRSTLLALHHANVTGNFSVLRDLGSPSFRQRNNPGALYESFGAIRGLGIQFDDIAVLQPVFAQAPTIEGGKYLRVSGSFPTKPKAVTFELLFELVDRVWLIVGLSVWPSE